MKANRSCPIVNPPHAENISGCEFVPCLGVSRGLDWGEMKEKSQCEHTYRPTYEGC